MRTKSAPAIVIYSLVFLGLAAVIGLLNVAEDFARWRVFGKELVPVLAIVKALILGVFPVLAIIDLCHRRPSGRYLALVPMIWVWGVCLRTFVMVMTARQSSGTGLILIGIISSFGIVVSLAALILGLGFSKKVDEYFEPND